MPRVIVVEPGDVVVRRPDQYDSIPTSRSRSPVHFLRKQLSRRGINLPLVNTGNATSGLTHRPVIRRASLAFVKQKLWLHPVDQGTPLDVRGDMIFAQHEENVQGELRRRKTEGDLRERAKFAEERNTANGGHGIRRSKISKPIMERPTVPRVDTGLREQYRRRQERWETSEEFDDFRVRRRDKRRGSPNEEHAGKSRWSMSELRRLSVSILQHEWYGRPIGGKKFTKPMPEEEAKHRLDAAGAAPEEIADFVLRGLENQRWSYGSRAESLEPLHPVRPPTSKNSPRSKHVRIATPSPVRAETMPTAQRPRQLRYSSSTSQLSQRAPQQPKKYRSVRELRSDPGPNPKRAMYRVDNARPPRQRPGDDEGDQRHIHPLLRTHPPRVTSMLLTAPDSDIALLTQARQGKKSEDGSDSSREPYEVDLILSYNRPETMAPATITTATERHTPQKPTAPSPSRKTISPRPSAGGIPNHPAARCEVPNQAERHIIHVGLNRIRSRANVGILALDPLLTLRAQCWAELELPPVLPPKRASTRNSALYSHTRSVATKIFPVPGQPATRLVSAPSIGPLACVELWRTGEFRRHKTVPSGELPGQHRYSMLPVFVDKRRSRVTSRGGEGTVDSRCSGLLGSCVCLEHDAWQVVTDPRWTSVGIGKCVGGRWVVELLAGC